MSDLHTDFAAAFRDGTVFIDKDETRLTVERIEVGSVPISSGTFAVGDPLAAMDAIAPPRGMLASGQYPVDISVMRTASGECFVAAARLTFRDGPVASWLPADSVLATDGEAGFADGLYEAGTMISEIRKALRASFVPQFGRAVVTGGQGTVAVFTCGAGGGEYAVYWGMTADEEPAQLCIDFDLLTEQQTEDLELTLPLGRGVVPTAGLEQYGVSASVSLLAPKQLKVRFRPPHVVLALWKSDGALQPVPIREHSHDSVTLDLGMAPAGATLLLRVPVKRVRMRAEAPGGGSAA